MPASRTTRPSSASIAAARKTYMATLPPAARRAIKQLRVVIRRAVPEAVESFSYGIPGFRLLDRAFVWYAGFDKHASLYPMTAPIQRAHAAALKGYVTSKGTVRFPLDAPIPIRLVRSLVMSRAAELRKEARRVGA